LPCLTHLSRPRRVSKQVECIASKLFRIPARDQIAIHAMADNLPACPHVPGYNGLPGAEKWQRVTHALARAVAQLARQLDWASVAAHFRLNWKTIEAIVDGAVLWGLAHRRWFPLQVIGLDEVSRRKGQQYLTIVYDLDRGRVVWVGRDRTAATMERFFAWLGPRRARAIHTVCCDMWAALGRASRSALHPYPRR